ncbi:four helix bundle protein [Patescibacteria group bacterium]|nr:four helix bundle protein [Patescibacteria group bacterium]
MQPTPVFRQSYDLYRHLYLNLRRIPKQDRFTWGERCERLALDLLHLAMKAETATHQDKIACLKRMSEILDALKIYLRLGDDLRILDHKTYLARSEECIAIGKMVGGWLKSLH